jgi:hypothetical protein
MKYDEDENVVYSSRNADKFVVRLPEGMRETIADIAKRYHRSMNSEIVNRLERSLDTPMNYTPTVQQSTSTDNDSLQSDTDANILALFHSLSEEKQQIIMQLLRSII